jgi:hypothetical protein
MGQFHSRTKSPLKTISRTKFIFPRFKTEIKQGERYFLSKIGREIKNFAGMINKDKISDS